MSNLRTKFVGFLSEGEDIDAICSSIGLNNDEKEELSKLGQRGYWLVKRAGEKPFVIRTDDFPIAKDMGDDELLELMKGYISELEQLSKVNAPPKARIAEPARVVTPQLSPDAWNLLVNVRVHPFFGIASRKESLKISARRIGSSVKELEDRKLVAPVEIQLGRFRPVKFLVPTNEALNLLRNVGQDVSLWKKIGNVGFEHSLYQVLITYSFRNKGLETTIEKTLPSGRRLDVYVDGPRKVGIEIELTTTNIQEKVQGIDELDELILLVKDEKTFQEFTEYLRNNQVQKVRVEKVTEFLRENDQRNRQGK